MNAATKTPTAKSIIRTFEAAGFSACNVTFMDGAGVQVWTLDAARAGALADAVTKTGLEWNKSGSGCWTITLKKTGMLVPPTRRPFC